MFHTWIATRSVPVSVATRFLLSPRGAITWAVLAALISKSSPEAAASSSEADDLREEPYHLGDAVEEHYHLGNEAENSYRLGSAVARGLVTTRKASEERQAGQRMERHEPTEPSAADKARSWKNLA